jgi:hypothetical protein
MLLENNLELEDKLSFKKDLENLRRSTKVFHSKYLILNKNNYKDKL